MGRKFQSGELLNDSKYVIGAPKLSRESSFQLAFKPLKISLAGCKDDLDFLWDCPASSTGSDSVDRPCPAWAARPGSEYEIINQSTPHLRQFFSTLSRLRIPTCNMPILESGSRIVWVPLPSFGLMHLQRQCHPLIGPSRPKSGKWMSLAKVPPCSLAH